LRWKDRAGGFMPHLGAYCPRCGRWLKWLPQTPAVLARAGPRQLELFPGQGSAASEEGL
jgi:hypothetical protein